MLCACVWISVGVQFGLVLRTFVPYICYKRRPRCKVLWDPAVRNSVRAVCVCVGTIFGTSPIAVTKPCQNTLITPCKPHVSNRITTFTTITTITTMVAGALSHGDSWYYHVFHPGPFGAPLCSLLWLSSYSVCSVRESLMVEIPVDISSYDAILYVWSGLSTHASIPSLSMTHVSMTHISMEVINEGIYQ